MVEFLYYENMTMGGVAVYLSYLEHFAGFQSLTILFFLLAIVKEELINEN